MVRITVQDDGSKMVTLKIEGGVTGPYVSVLQRAWQELARSLGHKKLVVDLSGLTFIDEAGRDSLAEMRNKASAEFLANTPMTKHFAAEAMQGVRSSSHSAA